MTDASWTKSWCPPSPRSRHRVCATTSDFCKDAVSSSLAHIDLSYLTRRSSGVDLVISEANYSYRQPASRPDDELTVIVKVRSSDKPRGEAALNRAWQQGIATAGLVQVAIRGCHCCRLPESLTAAVENEPRVRRWPEMVLPLQRWRPSRRPVVPVARRDLGQPGDRSGSAVSPTLATGTLRPCSLLRCHRMGPCFV